jgi:hypothetical protein
VEHLAAQTSGTASAIISKSLQLSPDFVKELIEFGAVYHSELMPPVPPHLDDAAATVTSTSGEHETPAEKKGKKRRHDQTEREFQEAQRKMRPSRLVVDMDVQAGAYFR